MIAEGIAKSTFGGTLLAADIARRWLKTNYVAFKQTGAMHEKYDVEVFGETGGGGEYTTQVWKLFFQALEWCTFFIITHYL